MVLLRNITAHFGCDLFISCSSSQMNRPFYKTLIQFVIREILNKTIKSFLSPVGSALRDVPWIGAILRNAAEAVPYTKLQMTKSFLVPAMPGWVSEN
uniref:Uncharacterized protein n=1 Tax=Candidatus Kentrum sp. LFY TaxID=2126342 RepID=A0A450X7G2_9GAMM|nr:MAG: hypothetical protein BECKLFY1418B_GA0070995_108915 [Candidatus Kentron sp. LFY]VFK00747.1 MAG: hypothetical protein BECKLFY1418A_GA0070994_11242 [Candidatus Kentron sp. LFY]VFK25150.1 MAG: hypothetical protein BECKLFY1418C_GA0070996_12191 [Candidatus Kentron sp. LFY]